MTKPKKLAFFFLELYVYRMQNAFENKENIRWRGKQARLVLAPNVQADFLRSNPSLTTSGIPCFLTPSPTSQHFENNILVSASSQLNNNNIFFKQTMQITRPITLQSVHMSCRSLQNYILNANYQLLVQFCLLTETANTL